MAHQVTYLKKSCLEITNMTGNYGYGNLVAIPKHRTAFFGRSFSYVFGKVYKLVSIAP